MGALSWAPPPRGETQQHPLGWQQAASCSHPWNPAESDENLRAKGNPLLVACPAPPGEDSVSHRGDLCKHREGCIHFWWLWVRSRLRNCLLANAVGTSPPVCSEPTWGSGLFPGALVRPALTS